MSGRRVRREDGAAGLVVDGRFLHAYPALAETGLHDGTVVRPADRHERAAADPVSGPVLAVTPAT